MKAFKFNWRGGEFFKKVFVFSLVLTTLISGSFSQPQNARAAVATNTFVQTDWSGGASTTAVAAHPVDKDAVWNKFVSWNNLAGAGALTLATSSASTSQTSSADFQTGATSSAHVENNSVVLDSSVSTTPVKVSAGYNHSLALKDDGTVWVWGSNGSGQLGDNSYTDRSSPVQVVGPGGVGYLSGIIDISGGNAHSLALKTNGTVWAWGSNTYGQLGQNNITASLVPVQVKGENGSGYLTGITKIVAGGAHSLALKNDGTVWAWGLNTSGQLGDGTTANILTPAKVKSGFVTDVAAGAYNLGQYSSIAAIDNNTIFISFFDATYPTPNNIDLNFAKSTDGGTTWTRSVVDSTGFVGYYTSIEALDANNIFISYFDKTNYHLKFAKSTNGGTNWTLSTVDSSGVVSDAGTSLKVVDSNNMFISYFGSLGLRVAKSTNGGVNWTHGEVPGNGAASNVGVRTSIDAVGSNVFVSYYGSDGSLKFAKSTDGGVIWTVSAVTAGAAGVGAFNSIKAVDANNIFISYVDVTNSDLKFAKSTNGGTSWTLSTVDSTNDVGKWNSIAALDANNIFISYVDVTNSALKFAKSTNGGTSWTVSVEDNSEVVSYDTSITAVDINNVFISYYQTGSGYLGFSKAKRDLIGIASIGAGGGNSLAAGADGSLWQWGVWSPGGSNTFATKIITSGVSAAAAGKADNTAGRFALKTDGTVWGWGINESYSAGLGDNGTCSDGKTTYPCPVSVNIPTQIPNLSGITAISAGGGFGYAQKNDGTVWGWGYNANGELGKGNVGSVPAITTIAAALGTPAIMVAGGNHGIAAKADKSVWSWGYNIYGQLGKGNTTSPVLTPSQIAGFSLVGTSTQTSYSASGTFTSGVMNLSTPRDFSTLDYSVSTPAGTSLTVDARAGNTATPDGTWTSWQTNISNGGSISGLAGNRYVQYRANLSGDTTDTPTLNDITFNYIQYSTSGSLISSPYNVDPYNALKSIAWTESLPAGTDVKFQLRTSANNSTWSSWLGPDGATSTYYTNPAGSESIPTAFKDASSDRYFQYQVTLTSDGTATPTLSDVSVSYEIFSAPLASTFSQYKADGTTAISTSTLYTGETSVVLKASGVSGLSGATTIKAQFEVKTVGSSFDGAGLTDGSLVADGSTSVATVSGLSGGTSYKWRGRLVDDLGRASDWTNFNSGNSAFTVDTAGPSVGSFTVGTPPSWATSTIDLSGSVGYYNSIDAIDANNIFISYGDASNGDLKFAKSTDGGISWIISTLDSTGIVGENTSIAAADANNIFISYYDTTNTDLKFAKSTDGGTSWTVSTIDSVGIVGRYGSIAAADANNIFISYYDTTNNDLKFAKSTDGGISWIITVANPNAAGYKTSVTAVNSNTIYISYKYCSGGCQLRFMKSIDGGISWLPATTVETAANGGDTSIAASDTNNIFISYYDNGNIDLKFAKSTDGGTSWSASTIESAGNVGDHNSIATLGTNNIFISYWDQNNNDLKLAKSIDGGINWIISTLNSIGDAGQYSSISAVDANNIFISYYTGVSLKFAKTSGGSLISYTSSTSIMLSLSASDSGSGMNQMRFSNDNASWSSWEAYGASKSWTLASGDGAKTVYVQFTDNAGNSSSGSTNITLDTQSPTFTSVSINSGASYTSSTSATVTLSASDAGSGLYQMRFSNDNATWGDWEAYSVSKSWTLSEGDGVKTVYAEIKDNAGGTTSANDSISIDSTGPALSSFSINSGASAASSTSATLSISVSDAVSGINQMRFSNDNATWSDWETYGTSKSWTLDATDGEKTVYAQFSDNAGNSTSTTDTITLDATGPAISSVSINSGSGYATSTSATISLSASDTGSGMNQMRFSNDNATWSSWETYGISKSWTLDSADGSKTVYINFSDLAGNTSATSTTITLDTQSPTFTSVSINSGASYTSSTSATVTLSASDAGSGLYQMRFSNDNASWSSWEAYGVSKSWTITEGDGVKTVYVEIKDNAGGITAANDSISIDSTGPVGGTIDYLNVYTTSTSATITLNEGTDAVSGISYSTLHRAEADIVNSVVGNFGAFGQIATTTGSVSYSDETIATDKAYQYRLVVADNAGNQTIASSTNILKVDNAGPAGGSVSYSDTLYDSEPVTIPVTSSGGTDSAGVASRSLQRASATLSQGVPGAWSGWTEVSAVTGVYNDTNVVNKTAYKYRLMETDNAGNISYSYCYVSTSTECVARVAFNTAPEANILTAAQGNTGAIAVSYEIRDTDSVTATADVGLQYWNGISWATASTTSLTGDYGTKPVNTSSPEQYTAYNLSWNPALDFPDQYFAIGDNFRVRIKVNDLEAAKNLGYGTSSAMVLDTKQPTLTARVNASLNKVFITSSDDTNLYSRVTSDATSTVEWTNASSTSLSNSEVAWTFDASSTNPTVTVAVKDEYNNTRSVSVIAPRAPQNVQWNDVSNPTASSYREFVGWDVYSPADGAAFANYKVYKSANDVDYSQLAQITDVSQNYYLDTVISSGQTYYYKMTVTDTDGDVSLYSSKFSDVPNGQGSSDVIVPVISNTTSTAETSWARITWTTDENADSRVEYATDGSYSASSTSATLTTAHSIMLTGLPAGNYKFRVKSRDANGNEATDDNGGTGYDFVLTPGPAISDVTAINIGDTSATISWNTNVDSNSYVYYSVNANMAGAAEIGVGNPVGADSATSTTFQHRINLGGLLPTTEYYYYVKSTDGQLRTATDSNGGSYYRFRTSLDNRAPSISAISTPVLSSQAGVVVWKTDESANSMVSYGKTAGALDRDSVLDTTLSKYHVVTLLSLEPLTKYYYQVKSSDEAGNQAVSVEQNFTTPKDIEVRILASGGGDNQKDAQPPTITEVKVVDILPFSAKIEFKTNEAALGMVEYGKTNAYGLRSVGSDYLGSHGVIVSGLRMGTEYHFRVKAADKSGNVSYSEDSTFKTKFFAESMDQLKTVENIEQFQEDIEKSIESIAPSILPPFIENPIISDITENSATVTWRTNINSFSTVSYSADDEYDATKENPYLHEVSDTINKVLDHKLILTGLKPNSRYHLIAKSFRIPDVVGKSEDIAFVTKASKVQARIFDVKNNSFKIAWTTDEPASSIVETKNLSTRETNRKIDDAKTTYHSMTMDNLTPATRYEARVFGYNEKGNLIESGDALSVVTSKDITAPKISNFKVDSALVPGRKDKTQTIVSWTTDEPATSVAQYLEGSSSGEFQNKVEINDSYVQTHNVILPNLKAGTIYQIKITSVDLSGNTSSFGPRTIITPTQTESIFDVIFKNFEDTFKFMRQVGQ